MPFLNPDEFVETLSPISLAAIASRDALNTQVIESPKLREVFRAAFEQENLAVAIYNRGIARRTQEPRAVPGYNAFLDDADLIGLERYATFQDNFLESDSPEETRRIASSIDRELENRDIIASSPYGMLAAFTAGVASPENLLPGFGLVRSARTGGVLLRAAAVGAEAASAAAISEIGLQATQETRTGLESAVNVTGAAILGGILGGGVSVLRGGRFEMGANLMEKIKKDPGALEEIENGILEYNRLQMAGASNDLNAAQVLKEALLKKHPEVNELYFAPGPLAKPAEFIARQLMKASPVGIAASSPRAIVRDLGERLMTSGFVRRGALEGFASPLSIEVRADRVTKLLYGIPFFASRKLYKEARAAGMRLKEGAFFDEVGRALRNNDEALEVSLAGVTLAEKERKAISASAGHWRASANVLLHELRRLGDISEKDLDLLGTDLSWMHRDFNATAMYRDQAGFIEAAANGYVGEMAGKSIEERRIAAKAFLDDYLGTDVSGYASPTGRPASMRRRQLMVKSSAIEKYLVNDPRRVNQHVFRQLARRVEMANEFYRVTPKQGARLAEIRGKVSKLDKAIVDGGGTEALRELAERIDDAKAAAVLEGSEKAERLEELFVERETLQKEIDLATKRSKERKELRSRLDTVAREIGDLRREAKALEQDTEALLSDLASRLEEAAPLEELQAMRGKLIEESFGLGKRIVTDAVSMKHELARVSKDYDEAIAKATGKEADALRKRKGQDLENLEVARDRLLGIRGIPKNPAALGFRVSRFLRNLNTARFAGSFLTSSLADASSGVMKQGFGPWAKSITSFATSRAELVKSIPDAVKLDAMLEQVQLSIRTAELAGLQDTGAIVIESAAERLAAFGANASLQASLLFPWNRGMKMLASVGITDNILNRAIRIADGTASRKDIIEMGRAGFDAKMAKRIAAERKHFQKIGAGVLATDISKWESKDAAKHFEAAVLRDVEFSLVTPGLGDMPAMVDEPLGKIILQFRSFSFGATNRLLIPGLQMRDAQFYSGMLAATAFGAVSYGVSQVARGAPISDDPGVVLANAIDRSGWPGIINDLDRILEIATSGRFGVAASLSNERTTRLQNVDFFGAIFGVSAGVLDDAFAISRSFTKEGDFTQGDLNRIRRYAWFQNHFALRRLFDQVAVLMGESWGLPDRGGFRAKVDGRGFIDFGGAD